MRAPCCFERQAVLRHIDATARLSFAALFSRHTMIYADCIAYERSDEDDALYHL